MLAGTIYAAGEEISWGQHLLGWSTPEFWSRVNDQQETNLHNTSFMLDQLPRLLVTILTVIVSIVIPISVSVRPELRESFIGRALCSPLALVPTFFVLSARLLPVVFPTMTEHGYPAGEAKELYVYLFGLVYLLESATRAQERGDKADTA